MGLQLGQPGLAALLGLDVLRPWALAALLVLVPAVWLAATSRSSAPRWREWLGTALRCLALAALVLALAEARLVRRSDRLCVIVLLDQSRSVDPARAQRARDALQAELDTMGPNHLYAVIGFGGQAVLQRLAGPAGAMPLVQGDLQRDFTDIAQAIRLALSVAPQEAAGRILLISDGNDSASDSSVLAAAAQARQAGVPIDVHTVGSASAGELWVERLMVDAQKRAGEPFTIWAVVHSDREQDVELTLRRRGQVVDLSPSRAGTYTRTVRLRRGANRVEVATERLSEAGFHDYEVMVEGPGDEMLSNNHGAALVRILGEPGVLIVDGSEGGAQGRHLLEALGRAGIRARLTGVEGFPADMMQLRQNDCLILSDVLRHSLSEDQMRLTRRWVGSGGALVWVGGTNSFGPGGYGETPIEELAPVSCQVKRVIERAGLALVVAIDQSGSMGAGVTGTMTKMDLANHGAAAAIQLLDERDEAGIVVVDTQYKWMTNPRLQRMSALARDRLAAAVRANRPGGGGIYCYTALRTAMDELLAAQAMSKHVILFADTDDAEQKEGCEELVAGMRRQHGITVSVIGLGLPRPGNDGPWLTHLAQVGGGLSFFTDNPHNLPQLFVRDVHLVSRNAFIEPDGGIVPGVIGHPDVDPVLRGIGVIPALRGQVATTLKDRATLVLQGHEPDDPLLAKWHYGLGKSAAWTSDASERWASRWIGWEDFSKFWSQVVRWAMRNPDIDSPVTASAVIDGRRGLVSADAVDREGRAVTDLNLRAVVEHADPEQPAQLIELRQVSPGRYEGDFAAERLGAYVVNVFRADGEQGELMDAAGAVMSYSPEFRHLHPDEALMRRIAHASGGRVLEAPTNLFVPPQRPAYLYRPVSLPLVALAMALFFADIVTRRFVLPETLLRYLAPARRTQPDVAVLGQLRTAQASVRESLQRPLSVAPQPGGTDRLLLAQQQARQQDRQEPPAPQAAPPDRQTAQAPPEAQGGNIADRLRAAKRRAQQEMEEKRRKQR